MKNLIRLTDYHAKDIYDIFNIADEVVLENYKDILKGKSFVLFFPNSSIRTRVTFEKGIYLLGGQPILFPTETLDKKEDLKDVCGYLNNWAAILNDFKECVVTLDAMKKANKGAVLNPCPPFYRGEEVSADVIDSDYFVGYKFKRHLLNVQQAVMVYCLT